MTNLKTVLLVDDDPLACFVHERLIRLVRPTSEVVSHYSGEEAISFIRKGIEESATAPELVFLDINMPGMNGWGFLEHYQKIDWKGVSSPILCMLTASGNPDDEVRARSYLEVADFVRKPLTTNQINSLLKAHFAIESSL